MLVLSVMSSSHSEAPESSNNPVSDINDFYGFRSYETGRDGYTSLISTWIPRHPPFGGPNYYALDPDFYYYHLVDTTGEGRADITFQFQIINELAQGGRGFSLFVGKKQTVYIPLKALGPITAGDNSALNFLEYYRINILNQNGVSGPITNSADGTDFFVKPWDNVGGKTFPDYSSYAKQYIYNIDIPGCATGGKVFVGQRADPFSINIGKIFDLINIVPIDGSGTNPFPGGVTNSKDKNVIRWMNVVAFALEVPTSCLIGAGNNVIGVWGASRSVVGNRQKSRLGNPLINELFIGLPEKDKWNRRKPAQDGLLNRYISFPTFPAIVNALFLDAVNSALGTNFKNLAPTNFPRKDLEAVFLTGIAGLNQLAQPGELRGGFVEYLRLNTSTPVTAIAAQNTFGVVGGDSAGYPNGRRPGDDVIDIALRAAMGALCYLPGDPYCKAADAVVGQAAFIDGAPVSAADFLSVFPYLNDPTPGSLDIN